MDEGGEWPEELITTDGAFYDKNPKMSYLWRKQTVEVTYTRYTNTKKPLQKPKPNDKTIEEAVEARLTPGKKNRIF